MKTNINRAYLIIFIFLAALLPQTVYGSTVDVIKIDGIINPVAADFIGQAIKQASNDSAECLVIELDTPGGLVESTRLIIKDMLASDVPVVVYVTPSGARAASAGTFITIASHIAAMTPGTHIGAAHPVTLQGGDDEKSTMFKKLENDMAAYIKSMATQRGRNAEWAEKAVRESVSITAEEALKNNIIDLICKGTKELLEKINGRKVIIKENEKTLNTAGASINRIEMSFQQKFFNIISDPNIAYILFLVGLVGIYFELQSPGLIFPGIAGVISLILAFFGMQTLPINYAGLALIIFGIFLFIIELYVPSYGLLTTGGVISFVLGSMMLIDTPYPFLRISLGVIIPVALAIAAIFFFVVGAVIRAHRAPVKTGYEGLIGEHGTADTDILEHGKISVHGEIWDAESDEQIKKGDEIEVTGSAGSERMVLKVRKKS